MQVILLERIGRLGQMGDVVNVKNGYARNFLLPQKKALRATEENLARFEGQRAQLEAQKSVEDTRRAMSDADRMMSEARTAESLARLAPLARGGYEETPGLVRYNGTAAWSITGDLPRLQQFFLARFGRPLPISALGQTALHDRMGFDHRNALDVAVHPDSHEGRALMEHLRLAGIPFIAAWGAIPGSTSGAHIHVGQPSPRFTVQR